MKKILLTGGTGFIGKYLVPKLLTKNFEVTILTREPEKHQDTGTVSYISKLSDKKFAYDVIINLAGATIAQRWSSNAKEIIYKSRIETTKSIIEQISKANYKPELLISGSAIGYYGTNSHETFTEDSLCGNLALFSTKLCRDWEDEAYKATEYGVRTCALRTGIVLEKDGGTLAKLKIPFELFLGGHIGTGKQIYSWVHMEDLLNLILFLIENKSIFGPVNAVAPNPISNEEFSTALGDALFRPVYFSLPAFLMKTIYGEMADELLLSGQRVLPKKLLDAGFGFKYRKIRDAMKSIY